MRSYLFHLAALAVSAGVAFSWPVAPLDESGHGPTSNQGGLEEIQLPHLAVGDPVDFDASLQAGADYLRRMQADITEDNAGNGFVDVPDDPDDGGWDWVVNTPGHPFSHTTAASPTNIYGATAQGLYYAYLESPIPANFTALLDAADFIVAAIPPAPPRSASDLTFLLLFNDLYSSVVAPTTVYADAAKAKYDDRITYYTSADSLAKYIRDVRGVSQGYPNGIIAWDIGVFAVVAQMLYDNYGGTYDADADAIAEVLWQDSFNGNPGLFDVIADAGFDSTYSDVNFWWYTLGITGLIDAFSASGSHTAEIPGLVTLLLDSQFGGGAVSGSYGANTNDEDWQSTAYAMKTLGLLDQATYQDDINRMGYWTGATQDASGGWVYGSGNHYPEIGGENTAGLYFTTNDVIDVIVDDDFTSQADVDVYNTANATSYVWGYTAFATVQEGIDAVNGSTVNVAPGTYPGNIVVPGGVNLLGTGGAAVTTLAGSGGTAVTITGDDVLIDGFTVTNPTGFYAISSTDNSGITISNNIVTDIGTSTTTGYVHAVVFVCTSEDVDDITVEDNILHAIHADLNSSASAITVGWSTGTYDVTDLLIQRNTIYDVRSNISAWPVGHGAYGILLNHGTGVTGKTVSAQILNNYIDDLDGLWSHGIGLEGNTPDAVVQGNVISNLLDHKLPSDAAAIQVEANASATSLDITDNSFTNLGPSGTDGFGVRNVTGLVVDARGNWWASSLGPQHATNPPGTGVSVTDDVLFDPWYSGNIIVVADPETLTVASPVKTVDVKYLGGGSGLLYGYSLKFSWDGSIASTSVGDVTEGTLLTDQGTTQFFAYGSGADEITVDCALLGAQSGVSGPGTMFSIEFTGLSQGTSPVDVTVVAARDSVNGPLTGLVPDDGLLVVDVSGPSVTGVLIENLTLAHTDDYAKDTDNLRVTATVTDDGPLTASDITADFSALLSGGGTAVPAESYVANVATWVVALANVTLTADGTKAVTVTATDGVFNTANGSDDIIVDNTPPTAITGLVAATHHERVALSWDDPSGLDLYPYGVVARYDGGGDYPEYATLGTFPASETGGDGEANNQLGVPMSGDHNIVARDIYFYTAFAYDWALNYGPAASSAQDSATNYWLGDVDDNTGPGGGDYNGDVDFDDISVLSAAYTVSTPPWPQNECDVGPTDDGSALGIPVPDDIVNFEDLIIFAMNFNVVCPACKTPFVQLEGESAKGGIPTLALASPADPVEVGQELTVSVMLSGNEEEIKGASMRLSYDQDNLQLLEIVPNQSMGKANAYSFFWGEEVTPGEIGVDFAVLGRGEAIHGNGELVTLKFQVRDKGDFSIRFDEVTARGVSNDEIQLGTNELAYGSAGATVPQVTRLSGAWPNPFNPATTIRYELKQTEHVLIEVFEPNGRLVRTLVNRTQDAGQYGEVWNGNDNNSRAVGTGTYLVRMRTGKYQSTVKIIIVR